VRRGLWDGPTQQQHEQARARQRVTKLATYDLLEWADVAGSGMSKAFMDYRRHDNVESLLEVRTALTALSALVDELVERHEAGARQ
jgi:hypothetical protein